jgi:hypothetical protein
MACGFASLTISTCLRLPSVIYIYTYTSSMMNIEDISPSRQWAENQHDNSNEYPMMAPFANHCEGAPQAHSASGAVIPSQVGAFPQSSMMLHRTSDPSETPSHHEDSQHSSAFLMSAASSMDPQRKEQMMRYLEQRLREEASRASFAEQTYLRAQEESRALQQAYASLLQPPSMSDVPVASFSGLPQQNIPAMAMNHDPGMSVMQNYHPSTAATAPAPAPYSVDNISPNQMFPPPPSSSTTSNMQHPMMYSQTNVAPALQPNFQQQQRLDDVAAMRGFPNRMAVVAAPTMDDRREEEDDHHHHHHHHHRADALSFKPPSALRIVNLLGSNIRHGKQYMDVANFEDLKSACCDGDDDNNVTPSKNMRSFPEKLHAVLTLAELDEQLGAIVSFCPHGRAFQVHDIKRFCSEILPKYFQRLNQWKSFTRQLNLYGFTRITYGPDSGGYYHELFLRHRNYLCRFLKRVGVTQPGLDRRLKSQKNDPNKRSSSSSSEYKTPDFYRMAPVR